MNIFTVISRCNKKLVVVLFTLTLLACHENVVEFSTNECRHQPAFVSKLGFDPNRSALTTSQKQHMGLSLIEMQSPEDTGIQKVFQDSSWKMAGWLGPIQLDEAGNCYVAPVPKINLLDNPPALQNIVYKVDSYTGKMTQFISLPLLDSLPSENPYGILGFSYLCETNTLYVSSIEGSSRKNEAGVIYAVDAKEGKIIGTVDKTDAAGLGISYQGGKRKLYIGSLRSPTVYSVRLAEDGKPSSEKVIEFSIEGLGPRGDDKVRKIKFNKGGDMEVYGLEFNYNLTAPTEKQETIYTYRWNDDNKKWQYLN